MKFKLLFSLILFAAITIVHNPLLAQNSAADTKAIDFIKGFYTMYMYEVADKNGPDEKMIDTLQRKYCTARFLAKLKNKNLEADPIIDAQDCDSAWVPTLTINKVAGKENAYVVTYSDNGGGNKIILHVLLLKSNDTFKIDNVW